MKMIPRLLTILPLLLLANASAEDIKVGALVFSVSDDWESQRPSSSMRAAELKATTDDGQEEIATFFYFGPGNAGGAPANIQRWQGQFDGGPTAQEAINLATDEAVKLDELSAEDLNAQPLMLVLSGTFMETAPGAGPFSGAPKTPRPDYRMLAAILPHTQGSVFVKLTGPQAAADEVLPAFTELVKSAID